MDILDAETRTARLSLIVVLGLCASSLGASGGASAPGPAPRADASAFLMHTMAIGNLGSTSCNARRYAFNTAWTLLAAPQDDGSVRLFAVATGERLPSLEGGFKVGALTYLWETTVPGSRFAFSSDGEAVVWSWGQKVVVWDVASRQVLLKTESPGALVPGDHSPAGVALRDVVAAQGRAERSTSGRWVESPVEGRRAFVNTDNDVEIHDAGGRVRVLPSREKGNRGRCTFFDNDAYRSGPQLLFSRDGRILCDSCRVTDVWDLSESVAVLLVRTGRLRRTAGRPVLSPDGRTLAYSWGGHGDGGFALLDVESARRLGPEIEVKDMGAMEFSPDGTRLGTVGWVPRQGRKRDFEVHIWSVDAIRSAAAPTR